MDKGAVQPPVPPVVDVEAWFRTWGPMVHRRCVQLLKSQAEADDAVQDVFVRVVRRQQAGGVVDDKP
ncbi:MAG TPA: sigma factor, partial [Myxococcota bacterium]